MFHLVLNNVIMKDNRIPPAGFTNAEFEAIKAAPVGETFQDGQHWHDTLYHIPVGASEAVVVRQRHGIRPAPRRAKAP